ncbi:NADH-quinone oxidoreductase subunit C [Elioraea sp.]|uniref:NADH-quinone oxidoreductase subunit C n=1 Tax=Elioraea sp. TaxID=2185103 RepID=UPI0025BD65FC|nr:NADH-quinone oxidoreductase subunit C [Elioraea sp.]
MSDDTVTIDATAEALADAFGPAILEQGVALGEREIVVSPAALIAVMAALRDDPRFGFVQLMDLCGVDWPERPERFDVVYHLLAPAANTRIRVVVPVSEGVAVPSVVSLFPAAGWFEREAWDLYGIPFEGNPDLRRLLTDYGFEGHPLRKDFPLTGHVELRYDEEQKRVVYEPVKLTQEFRNFDFLSPWEGMTTLPGDEKANRG